MASELYDRRNLFSRCGAYTISSGDCKSLVKNIPCVIMLALDSGGIERLRGVWVGDREKPERVDMAEAGEPSPSSRKPRRCRDRPAAAKALPERRSGVMGRGARWASDRLRWWACWARA